MAKSASKLEFPGGMVHILGEHGSGKTTLALTYPVADPSKVYVIDDDFGKGESWAKSLGYNYVNGRAEFKGTDIVVHRNFMNMINSLPGDLELLVIDNPARLIFNSGFNVFDKDASKWLSTIKGTAEIVGGIKWRTYRNDYLGELYDTLQSKARTVVIVTHEKPQRLDGVKTGAMEAEADPSLRKAAKLIMRLTRSLDYAPIGLVVKDGIGRVIDGKIVRCLPDRIAKCNWDTILHYYNNDPIGLREAREDERPSEYELSLIKGVLTAEQQSVYEQRLKIELAQIRDSRSGEIVEIYNANFAGMPVPIAAPKVLEIVEKRHPDITVSEIMDVLSRMQEDPGE